MVGAIRLEQLILEVVANVSRDAWVPLSIEGLQKQLRKLDSESNGASFIALVEAIMALELAGFLSIQKHDGASWLLPYDRAMLRDELYKLQYFGGDKFELRLTHKARKGLDKLRPTPAGPKSAKVASEDRVRPAVYGFHPEIQRVSGQLFRDGHHKQAALEAYIRVIEEVKRKSGLDGDGDSLMNRAFGCDKQIPVIRFNNLQSDAERDEQKGIMFLFKGVVSLLSPRIPSSGRPRTLRTS
jgi:uncharacterized protein (TIGR02391 family)